MTPVDSQQFESYVPVYDTVPEDWEDARPFLVEHLKKISNAVNIRVIGWLLDEEYLNGKQIFGGSTSGGSDQFRSVLMKVIDFSPLAIGVNSKPHGIVVDANFSLINLYGAATDAVTFTGNPINQPDINYDAVNINITSAKVYTRAFAFIEYIQEL